MMIIVFKLEWNYGTIFLFDFTNFTDCPDLTWQHSSRLISTELFVSSWSYNLQLHAGFIVLTILIFRYFKAIFDISKIMYIKHVLTTRCLKLHFNCKGGQAYVGVSLNLMCEGLKSSSIFPGLSSPQQLWTGESMKVCFHSCLAIDDHSVNIDLKII